VVSNADARGLMQIQPATLGWLIMREQWALTAEQVQQDPALQVRLGVRYVRYLHDRFGNLDAALMAYNMGPTKFGIVSGEEHGLDAYWGYARAVRRDTAALKAKSTVDGASMAIRNSGAKPLATADGLWGG
jgi:soluble lytic murein transglycosylase